MAILKVARLGHPILRQVAAPVPPEGIGAPAVQQCIDDLIETMVEYDGAGLAAPQVHVLKQIVVFAVEGNPRYPHAESVPLTVLINPKVTPTTQDMAEDWEGCLSIPDLRGKVPRYTHVQVEAYDRTGKKLHYAARDFHARVVQHECDHLLGTVFLDRMRSMQSLAFTREFTRYAVTKDAGSSG
ncbi:MAG: peptide deformylase [Candidatus Binatia bacterium]